MGRNAEGGHIRVFMLGWEFPPFISGGLGTACYGLTRAMDQLGVKVTFVLPKTVESEYVTHVKLLSPRSRRSAASVTDVEDTLSNVIFRTIASPLQAYANPENYDERVEESLRLRREMIEQGKAEDDFHAGDYSGDMYSEIRRYATMAVRLAREEQFDVVHAHDWMTYPAGVAVAAVTGRPLVVHVHSTEFDRSGEHVNQVVYDIEREGMERADKVITVSHFTRSLVISRYGIAPEKVDVVYNGVERNGAWSVGPTSIKRDEKLVLFLGRITMQKGPEYFLHAAKKVLEAMDNVKFVMAGSGDLMYRSIELAAQLGIGQKVLFTGFLRGDDVRKIYQMADLYVMPSVSEPFGIAPLEALDNDVPVIISKQSGVSEVLRHALKVDFWDVNEMANKIVAVLRYSPLRMTLRNHGNFEVRKLRWKDAAGQCAAIYEQLLVAV
ncbi:glycosyltransferase family 4 protein [Anaerobaca lacustris]|uniref:Glycosyltransferase family 4 protein n=1 Tax=Anaerobaca lacustris TaxID=3044600 RepID=A0AAW6TTN9_9BACT|nr:glycosyltransferase family 4 protein [Sedimentisphaerales bacterium M17dextr]